MGDLLAGWAGWLGWLAGLAGLGCAGLAGWLGWARLTGLGRTGWLSSQAGLPSPPISQTAAGWLSLQSQLGLAGQPGSLHPAILCVLGSSIY